MMPDKIYIGHDVYNNVDEYWEENSNTDIPGKSYVEYIRKDALLEKLEKVAAEYKKRSDEGELVWQNMCGIKEAINILNKM